MASGFGHGGVEGGDDAGVLGAEVGDGGGSGREVGCFGERLDAFGERAEMVGTEVAGAAFQTVGDLGEPDGVAGGGGLIERIQVRRCILAEHLDDLGDEGGIAATDGAEVGEGGGIDGRLRLLFWHGAR